MSFFSSRNESKSGFTLVEVMFVILIISILAVLAVNAYVDARFRGLLIVQSDRVAESLRESQYRTTRGDSRNDGVFCKGVDLRSGDQVSLISGDYVSGEGCKNFKEEKQYTLSTPVNMVLEGPLRVYYEPPNGKIRVFTGATELKSKQVFEVQFGADSRDDLKRVISLDPITGSVTVDLVKSN